MRLRPENQNFTLQLRPTPNPRAWPVSGRSGETEEIPVSGNYTDALLVQWQSRGYIDAIRLESAHDHATHKTVSLGAVELLVHTTDGAGTKDPVASILSIDNTEVILWQKSSAHWWWESRTCSLSATILRLHIRVRSRPTVTPALYPFERDDRKVHHVWLFEPNDCLPASSTNPHSDQNATIP